MRIFKFALVGSTGFAVDALLFYLFIQLDCPIELARIVAFWCAATITWLGNRIFTFRQSVLEAPLSQWFKHMGVAHLSGIVNLLVFFLSCLIVPIAWAFVLGVITGTLSNYILSICYSFRQQANTPLISVEGTFNKRAI